MQNAEYRMLKKRPKTIKTMNFPLKTASKSSKTVKSVAQIITFFAKQTQTSSFLARKPRFSQKTKPKQTQTKPNKSQTRRTTQRGLCYGQRIPP